MKIDIGTGESRNGPEYTTVDLYNPKANIKATMWKLPFDDNSVDELFSEAALEHVSRTNVGHSLKEWHRVLKPGGKATIIVPNFDYIAQYWLDPKADRIWAHMLVFGTQCGPGEFHKTAFTPETFYLDLIFAGFQVLEFDGMVSTHMQQMMRATCTKIHAVEVKPEGEAFTAEFEEEKEHGSPAVSSV